MAQYLTQAEFLALSLPAEAFTTLPAGTIDSALKAASRFADSYLRKRYALPLVSWDDDLREAVGNLGALRLMRFRGFKPGSGTNEAITKAAQESRDWLVDISKGLAELANQVDQTPDDDEAGPLAASDLSADFEFFVSADGTIQGVDPFG